VALLNLTGLGIGYVYMRRWRRWLVHALLTAGILVSAIASDADRSPSPWLTLFAAWLLWMAFDGWRQARQMIPAAWPESVRRPLPLALALALVGLEVFGIWGYGALGQREFELGEMAYLSGDCRTAMQHFNRVATFYRLTFSPNVTTAEARIIECSLFVFAESARRQGEYADAVSAYEAYLGSYADRPLVEQAKIAVAETYAEWANALHQSDEYAAAVETYQTLFDQYADTPAASAARASAAETYMDWATRLRQTGDYATAIEKYEVVLSAYFDTALAEQAHSTAAAVYAEWAAALRKDGEYQAAVATYETIRGQFADTATAAEAYLAAAETYVEWAAHLRQDGAHELAISKYQVLLGQYADAPVTTQVEAAIAGSFMEWAAQLRRDEKYSDAIKKYQIVLNDYADTVAARTAQASIGATYSDWGSHLYSQRKYIEAMEKFTRAREASQDSEVLVAAEKGYAEALAGLSQDTGNQGRQAMSQAVTAVCAGRAAASPAIGLAKNEPGKALACSDSSKSLVPTDLMATRPAHFRYVVSIESGSDVIQSCEYGFLGQYTLYRERQWSRVKVRLTTTGQVTAERLFWGSLPIACPYTYTFRTYFGFGGSATESGGPPSTGEIANWVRGIVR
jgi:tetratricopeptide (TPR) repeat protein